jgi:hypothetical protein
LLAVAATVLTAAAAAAALARRLVPEDEDPKARATRALASGAALLCLSVALDSAIEHYRGQFKDPVMFAGPTIATIGFAAGTYLTFRPDQVKSRSATAIFALTAAAGAIGFGFHAYNIIKRPGHIDELNLFYAAPAGAPAALTLAGGFGLLAGRIATSKGLVTTRLAKLAEATVAFGLIGTVAEAALLHFRGAFQNPAMYAPVTLPPVAALATAAAAAFPKSSSAARPLLEATAVLGIAGPIFHAYGVHRNMGGWRNWSQMVLQGPPLPAPPAFLALAIIGLGLLPLLEEEAA